MFSLPVALVECSARFFRQSPVDARTALALIHDAQDMRRRLLAGGHSTVARRFAGAFRGIGRARMRTTPSKPCVRETFAPEMAAGLVQPFDLAGYRNAPIYIRRRLAAEYGRLDVAINPPM